MRKLPARKLLAALVAGALLLPETGFTLGLGEIEVNSALNQKLNADIELLSATVEDTENIIVKLASRKEFSRAGLDRPYLLNDLSFKSEVIDGVPHIKVTSSGPIREPFLNFLVEIDWPNGHLLREYTVLLDPPAFMTQPASMTSAPVSDHSGFRPSSSGSTNVVPVVTPAAPALSSRPTAAGQSAVSQPASEPMSQQPATPVFMPAPMVQQQTTINQPQGSYRIKQGDTAWSLADAMRPDQSISVEQMMIAMLRSNPESFINENINGLKRGYILRVPDYNQIAAVNQAEARALVREQAALWRQFQQSQAGGQPVSAMPAESGASSTGVSDTDAAVSDEDAAYLEIVSAGSGASTMSAKDPTSMTAEELRAELALARERVETEKVEKEALQQRVDLLQQNVDKMKGMLSIEDNELSDVQALNLPAEEVAAVDSEFTEMAELQAEQELQQALSDETAESLDTELSDEVAAETETEPAASDAVEEVAAEGDAEEAIFVDEAAAPADETVAEMAEPVQAEPAMEATPPPALERAPADPLTRLLNDPMLLAAAGGGLLLVVALIGLILKRRKSAVETEAPAMDSDVDDIESVADEVAVEEAKEAESLAGDQADDSKQAAAADFDSDATITQDSTENTITTEAEPAVAEDEESRDDVIAEADVYLAYGIYQQAADLLAQAIADNPDREDYRVKLAETHYASKDAQAFVEAASEIKQRVDSEDSPAWKKVMVMGQDLCADNPMFQGTIGDLDVASLAPDTPDMDFDLGLDDAGDNASAEESDAAGDVVADLDLTLGDEALDLPEMDDAGATDEATQLAETEDETSDEPIDELEFDFTETGAIEAIPETENELSLDIEASELDIDTPDEAEKLTGADEESMELDDIDIGLDTGDEDSSADEETEIGDINIDFGMEDDAETPAEEEEVSLDLTEEAVEASVEEDVAFDLTEEAASLAEEEEVSLDLTDADDDFDLSSIDDVDEISTKLDLARAYLDMGDHEGTREILDEVLTDGNDEQKQEANELMTKLN